MTRWRDTKRFWPPLFAAAALCWITITQASAPQLGARDLPPDVLNECTPDVCAEETDFQSRWLGRSPNGDLFLVARRTCASGRCTQWLVEKGAAPARALLEFKGAIMLHPTAGRYPTVELRTRSDDEGIMRLRFEWDGSQYTRTAARRVYEVNGVECGTREECHSLAQRALKAQQVDRALRIWQRVYGWSWI